MKNLRQKQERRPHDGGWAQIPLPAFPPGYPPQGTLSLTRWTRDGVMVMSALEYAQYPDGDGAGPIWHISISKDGQRAGDDICQATLATFGLEGADEDNHEPGVGRNFWLPVDPSKRTGCECKETERVVVEPNGHVWTTPADPAEGCRGCKYEFLFGKPCPIHKPAQQLV